jgi:uncharacterized protein YegP (UPF0339 family)
MALERHLKVTGWGPIRMPGERRRTEDAYKRACDLLDHVAQVPHDAADDAATPDVPARDWDIGDSDGNAVDQEGTEQIAESAQLATQEALSQYRFHHTKSEPLQAAQKPDDPQPKVGQFLVDDDGVLYVAYSSLSESSFDVVPDLSVVSHDARTGELWRALLEKVVHKSWAGTYQQRSSRTERHETINPLAQTQPRPQADSGASWPSSATFEIYTDAKGEFRFRLKAGNGEIVATGEGYKTKSAVIEGVAAVKRAAADAEIEGKADV